MEGGGVEGHAKCAYERRGGRGVDEGRGRRGGEGEGGGRRGYKEKRREKDGWMGSIERGEGRYWQVAKERNRGLG